MSRNYNEVAATDLIMALLTGPRKPRLPLTPEQQLEADKRAERALWNRKVEAKKQLKKERR